MHCLPADITGLSCEEGEVDNSVFDRYLVPLYKEASYKPYIIAAMIFMSQVKDPVRALMAMDEGNGKREDPSKSGKLIAGASAPAISL